jgi:hypothetical protein
MMTVLGSKRFIQGLKRPVFGIFIEIINYKA